MNLFRSVRGVFLSAAVVSLMSGLCLQVSFAADTGSYTVQRGDTLGSIAQKIQADAGQRGQVAAIVRQIQALNPGVGDGRKLAPGQTLKIPVIGAQAAAPAAAPAPVAAAPAPAPAPVAAPVAAAPAAAPAAASPGATELEAIEVTGSRIRKSDVEGQSPVLSISREDLEAAGIGSIGDILQRLPVSSSSLNTKFNSAGNFGFPPDGGGVGSGSTTVSLRHLGAKRVLVLVDGLRWINESSASGVSAAVDLNTIPFSIVERVDVLTDGASSIYGSDAIAGVVNIITRKQQDGGSLRVYGGDHSTGDGSTRAGNISFGGSGGRFDFFGDVSYFDQNAISSDETEQSRFPVPGTGLAFGSSATPTTRSLFFDPANDTQGGLCPLVDTDDDGVDDSALCNITANGTAAGPGFVHSFPSDFHAFDGGPTGDRFNYGAFNLLLTPSERTGLFSQVRYELGGGVDAYVRGLYQSRSSVNQAAPEPIFIGPGAGTGGLADSISVDVTNIYNPFGYTLDAGSNLIFAARRPLEGGPRVFTQSVDTRYLAGGLKGDFDVAARHFFWDVNLIDGRNNATQTVEGTYNIAHIARALGPDAGCTAPCVPLNFFGGPGTITPEMLDYIGFTEYDRSTQQLGALTGNLTGDLFALPAGPLDFAAGYEYRRTAASYAPDSVVTSGETNGVPSLPTNGSYTVDEAYLELHVPLLADAPGAKKLDVSAAVRYSDYSTFGSTTNSKFGVRWSPWPELIARATLAEGFRAPSVGELFGSPARFDVQMTDPCSDATDPDVIANCTALGAPPPFSQANTQISVRTGGNEELEPETTDSTTAGIVYSPAWAAGQSWASRMDFELTYYKHSLEDAIQSLDAQTQLDRCVATLDPLFCNGITRGTSGDINGFDNTLLNLGTIDTSGWDFGVDWAGPPGDYGRFGADWQLAYVDEFEAVSKATGLAEPRTVGIEVNDSAIPRVRSTLRLKWSVAAIDAGWTLRYLAAVDELCDQDRIDLGVCPASGRNELEAVTYHDIRVRWHLPGQSRATLAAGANNVFGQDPPVCTTCSLNGYDASTYDLPGTFAYVEASVRY